MSAVAGWVASGVGAGGAALAVTLHPGLLGSVLVTVGALAGLPLLLITALALVAVYSPDPDRRAAAEKVLERLLAALRPPQSTPPAARGDR